MSETGRVIVKVLFFGATAEAAGRRSLDLDVPAGSPSAEAFRRIGEMFPGLAAHRLLYAVNEAYSDGGERLGDGDELAVFTAVSGG